MRSGGRRSLKRRNWVLLKTAVFLLCLLPVVHIVWDGFHNNLTANPITEMTHRTGDWVLRFLLITLAISPLRRLTGWNRLIKFRRMFGNFAFFYVCLHLTIYLWLDRGLMFGTILEDVAIRLYITVGFASFLMLIPLAVTSTKGWVRRMGGKRWQALHRLVYLAAAGGVVHYYWLVKADHRPPLIYAAILAALLGIRVFWWAQKRRRQVQPA